MEGGPGLQVSEPRPEARLGVALRRARESRGVALRALARTLHRSHSTLVEYERGHRLAPLDVVEAYESELGLGAGTLAAVHEGARLELYGEDRAHLRTYVVRHPSGRPCRCSTGWKPPGKSLADDQPGSHARRGQSA